jgi:hypothetical protein
LKEKEQDGSKSEIQEHGTSSALALFTQALPVLKFPRGKAPMVKAILK